VHPALAKARLVWLRVPRTLKNTLNYYRRTKELFLVYGGAEELVANGYTNASFQTGKDDSKSQSRYVFSLNGGV
jgi:hypothetical protein